MEEKPSIRDFFSANKPLSGDLEVRVRSICKVVDDIFAIDWHVYENEKEKADEKKLQWQNLRCLLGFSKINSQQLEPCVAENLREHLPHCALADTDYYVLPWPNGDPTMGKVIAIESGSNTIRLYPHLVHISKLIIDTYYAINNPVSLWDFIEK